VLLAVACGRLVWPTLNPTVGNAESRDAFPVRRLSRPRVVVQFEKEASQTRRLWRDSPRSLGCGKSGLLGMTIKLFDYQTAHTLDICGETNLEAGLRPSARMICRA